jgi:hypothetical protein
MRVRNERSNDIYRPSHDAACGLVFSSLDHVWLLNALLIGALAWPGADVTLYPWRHALSRWMRARGVNKWEVQGNSAIAEVRRNGMQSLRRTISKRRLPRLKRSGSSCKTSEPAPSQSVGAFLLRI